MISVFKACATGVKKAAAGAPMSTMGNLSWNFTPR
jgi:hypothetical protein